MRNIMSLLLLLFTQVVIAAHSPALIIEETVNGETLDFNYLHSLVDGTGTENTDIYYAFGENQLYFIYKALPGNSLYDTKQQLSDNFRIEINNKIFYLKGVEDNFEFDYESLSNTQIFVGVNYVDIDPSPYEITDIHARLFGTGDNDISGKCSDLDNDCGTAFTITPPDKRGSIPIDGGLSFLAIAGLGFGIYKGRK